MVLSDFEVFDLLASEISLVLYGCSALYLALDLSLFSFFFHFALRSHRISGHLDTGVNGFKS